MQRRWLVGLVGAACLIGLYVALLTPRPTPPLPAEVPARRPAPAANVTPAVSPPSIASAPAAVVAAAPMQPRQIDLTCREEDIPRSQTEEPDPMDRRAAVLAGQQLMREVRSSLEAAGDTPSRALALYLAAMNGSFDPKGCEGNDCKVPVEAQSQVSARAASDLALMAQATKLPQAFSWALHACSLKANDPVLYSASCGNVSAQHWADAAPNNAWPWLRLATEAQGRNDASGVESAMHRAALASDWQQPGDEARRMLVSHLPPSVTSTSALYALSGVGFLHAEKAGMGALLQYCGANQDANRAQTCARLAAGLLKSSNDLLQLSVAIKVGARSGWPQDLLAAAESQRIAAHANMKSTLDLLSDPRRKCPFHQVQARVTIRAADIGEMAAIEEEFRARPR
jgi:hypothetical protein